MCPLGACVVGLGLVAMSRAPPDRPYLLAGVFFLVRGGAKGMLQVMPPPPHPTP
jgi:hypothetical protein